MYGSLRVFRFAIPFILLVPSALGQGGLIQGVVVDPADAAAPNAKVAAWDEAKGILVRLAEPWRCARPE